MPLPWVVLKFGGTSVATAERWQIIIGEVFRVRAAGERPFVVVSALSQVTNRLNRAIEEALNDTSPKASGSSYEFIYNAHMTLAEKLGVKDDTKGMQVLIDMLTDLERLLEGVRLCREASPRLCARVSAFGERMSSQLGLLAIKAHCPCVRLDARKLLFSTETRAQQDADRFLNANADPKCDVDLIDRELQAVGSSVNIESADEAPAVITQGFIGSTPKGDTCLLGRGGSDTSGALLSALLGARRCEIWTDVHGLFTSDPRHVKNTRLIRTTNYRVAQELASMGAKVLHPRCLVPAAWGNIPVEVHNTNDPKGPFTCICGVEQSGANEDGLVLAVTSRSGQILINIKNLDMWNQVGFLSRIFAPFGELDVSVDLVATSQYAVSLTLDHIPGGVEGDVFARLKTKLSSLGEITKCEPCAVVSIVGEHLRHALPELGSALEELREKDVHLMTQSSEDLNLSFVVEESQATAVVQGLHSRLFPVAATGGTGGRLRSDVFGETWEELKTASSTDRRASTSVTPPQLAKLAA